MQYDSAILFILSKLAIFSLVSYGKLACPDFFGHSYLKFCDMSDSIYDIQAGGVIDNALVRENFGKMCETYFLFEDKKRRERRRRNAIFEDRISYEKINKR